ncbi:ABC transporter permease [Amycolatopsis acidiphila]|uniref:ABC transporter permease n=1 Tax=Amycolatopsis acidiphila TaxID=715473 RepID=A0A557ZWA1_9PSEU|nr:ABC transporter permease [Amycolatopsis acidiphila]TVT16301.1 ABC transporter permease [Amycolatopsis acidiphila]UIJ56819.1 ABC transporter permease [Amycolatopsis acidiphila]GHG54954.1 ABC transporter permease [Amycolatopsis acidiphila]
MLRYLCHRLWQSAVTLVLASIVVFVGVRALPGDPATAMAGEQADPAAIAAVRAQLGLDEPLPVQYLKFAGHALTGDFGRSARTGTPVREMIGATLPVTVQLAVYAMLIAVLAGMAGGVVAAVFRGRWPEWAANGFSLFALSVPTFWLGILAVLYLSVQLGWFPASGYVSPFDHPLRGLYYLTLPAVILGLAHAAVVQRQTRSSMVETLTADFVRTARAKGLGRGAVVFRYGLRNSLIVVTTIVGLQLGGLIAGAVVTERIFSLPGIGKLTLDSVFSRDYPVIQAVVLVITTSYIVINLLVDLLYTVIDPRLRVSGRTR